MKAYDRIAVSITAEPISVAQFEGYASPADGALVVFAGVVRGDTSGRAVSFLDYEAYHEMASKQLHEIAEEAIEKFGVTSVAILHRTGRLDVGEVSVVVAVAAPHRAEAFDACEHCIDTVKDRASIWKKEQFEDGEATWVEHP